MPGDLESIPGGAIPGEQFRSAEPDSLAASESILLPNGTKGSLNQAVWYQVATKVATFASKKMSQEKLPNLIEICLENDSL